MQKRDRFEMLKETFVKEANAHIAAVTAFSYDDIIDNNVRIKLSDLRLKSVLASVEFPSFIADQLKVGKTKL